MNILNSIQYFGVTFVVAVLGGIHMDYALASSDNDFPEAEAITILNVEYAEAGPEFIEFKIENTTQEQICFRQAVVDVPVTYLVGFFLRDNQGNEIDFEDGVLIPEPEGLIQLQPSDSVTVKKDFSGWFSDIEPSKYPVSGKILVAAVYCNDAEIVVRDLDLWLASRWHVFELK